MKLYTYTAILSKTMVMQGKVTYTDTRQRTADCAFALPLDSECVIGHVLAENATQAKTNATELLKQGYPVEQHYSNHENVSVRHVKETLLQEVMTYDRAL